MKTPTALAALIVASIGLMALPALAQDTGSSSAPPAAPPAPAAAAPGHGPAAGWRHHMRLRGPMAGAVANHPFAMLALACSDKGAGALEKLLDRSARRLAATAEQQQLFDAFRSKDNDTACAPLDKVADRAPSDSTWKGKAESLYLKKCGA